MKKKHKDFFSAVQFLLIPVLLITCVCIILTAVGDVESGQKLESAKRVEDTIKKAVVNCYAIEGRYPATLEYVEEYYGLQINRDRYEVFYDVFADNIMPEITVLSK